MKTQTSKGKRTLSTLNIGVVFVAIACVGDNLKWRDRGLLFDFVLWSHIHTEARNHIYGWTIWPSQCWGNQDKGKQYNLHHQHYLNIKYLPC